LASFIALSANDPVYQPGFERCDTAVTAAVVLYGYFGDLDAETPDPDSLVAHLGRSAAPFFVAHGERDALVPPSSARRFVERLRRVSARPVVYVELPG